MADVEHAGHACAAVCLRPVRYPGDALVHATAQVLRAERQQVSPSQATAKLVFSYF